MKNKPVQSKWFTILAWVVMLAAVIVRVLVYLQNRNLLIDEANVARNIYERDFIGLLSPLSYQQFATPVFLWFTKLATTIAGYSEYALRFYPLLCGIVSILLMYKILKKLIPQDVVWFGIGLIGGSGILIRYSSELKQYMSDAMIALLIIWLAICIDPKRWGRGKFVLVWLVIGSLSIWLSMPSVFLLAGVGGYYIFYGLRNKQYNRITDIIIVSVLWVAQFGAYFFIVLKDQANSNYLQSFHHYYFLFATPSTGKEWEHNLKVIHDIITPITGELWYVYNITVGLLLVGTAGLLWKHKEKVILFLIPVLTLFIAAAIDQYSLMPRLAIFIMPVFIIVAAVGLGLIFSTRFKVVKVFAVFLATYIIVSNVHQTTQDPFKYEEVTTGYKYAVEKGIPASSVGIYHATVPAHIYYTQIHPNKEQWSQFTASPQLQWYVNYDSLAWQLRYVQKIEQPVALIYTNATDHEFKKRNDDIKKHLQEVFCSEEKYVRFCVYKNPDVR